MKLQIFKQSGDIVDPKIQERYMEDFKAFYDKAADRAGLDMQKLTRYMSYGERQIFKKHSVDVFETLPTTAKQWKALISKYGDYPIIVAKRSDKEATVLIIADRLT